MADNVPSDTRGLLTDHNKQDDRRTSGWYFPHRYRLFLLLYTVALVVNGMRASFNLALVSMVNLTAEDSKNSSDECPVHSDDNSTTPVERGTLDWSPTQQGQLLSSFYYTYIILQIPAGYLSEKFGAKKLILVSTLGPALINLLIPVLAKWDFYALLVARLLAGLLSGAVYSAQFGMWARWAPEFERTRLISMSISGLIIGEIIAFGSTGFLCQSSFLGGWPLVFYIWGVVVCIWCVFWQMYASDTPATDPTISVEEREYIEANTENLDHAKYRAPPVRSILTSPRVWTFWIVSTTDCLGFYMLFTSLPLYMRQVLRFGIATNGLTTLMPFASNAVASFIYPSIADKLREKGILSTMATRKLMTAIGTVGMSILFAFIPTAGCDRFTAVGLLIASTALNAACISGYYINAQDIAPLYAGTLTGVGNMFASFMGFAAPLMVTGITKDIPSLQQWSYVFYIMSGVMAFGGIQFVLLASGEIQEWAKPDIEDDDDDLLPASEEHHIQHPASPYGDDQLLNVD